MRIPLCKGVSDFWGDFLVRWWRGDVAIRDVVVPIAQSQYRCAELLELQMSGIALDLAKAHHETYTSTAANLLVQAGTLAMDLVWRDSIINAVPLNFGG